MTLHDVTMHQTEALILVGAMFVLFAWDRIRYDLVATMVLLAGLLTGVVPEDRGFSGFGNPVIIIIASVLVISRAVAVSGVIDNAMRRLLRVLNSTTLQVGALTAAVSFLSAFVKNVGTLGIFMPVAIQAAERAQAPGVALSDAARVRLADRRHHHADRHLAQPADLARCARRSMGKPYQLFDFTPVGLPLTCVAVAFLSVRLAADAEGPARASRRPRSASRSRTTPARAAAGRLAAGRQDRRGARGAGRRRGDGRRRSSASRRAATCRGPNWTLLRGDILVLQGDPTALQPVVDQAKLEATRRRRNGGAEAARQGR